MQFHITILHYKSSLSNAQMCNVAYYTYCTVSLSTLLWEVYPKLVYWKYALQWASSYGNKIIFVEREKKKFLSVAGGGDSGDKRKGDRCIFQRLRFLMLLPPLLPSVETAVPRQFMLSSKIVQNTTGAAE